MEFPFLKLHVNSKRNLDHTFLGRCFPSKFFATDWNTRFLLSVSSALATTACSCHFLFQPKSLATGVQFATRLWAVAGATFKAWSTIRTAPSSMLPWSRSRRKGLSVVLWYCAKNADNPPLPEFAAAGWWLLPVCKIEHDVSEDQSWQRVSVAAAVSPATVTKQACS